MFVKDYVCVDIETTGVNTKWSKIIEIGAVKVRRGEVVESFSELINPGDKVTDFITELTGITDEMLQEKQSIEEILPKFIQFAGGDVLLGHNLMFDFGFLKQNAVNLKLPFEKKGIDTLKIARKALPNLHSRGLEYLCEYYGIKDENHHRALNDAKVTSELYLILMEKFGEQFPQSFEPKELLYKVKKMQSITERQKSYLEDLIRYHNIEIDYDLNQLTKNEASKKIDKILSEKGRIFY